MRIFYINTHDTGVFTSPYGYNTPTPNLLEFAKDATVFRNAHTVSPTCSPSRGALLTGQYPHMNGLVGLTNRGFSIKDKTKHLANFLKENKYHTVLAGLQHENGLWVFKKPARELGYKETLIKTLTGLDGDSYAKWDAKNADKLVDWIHKNHEKEDVFVTYGCFATHRKYPETAHDARWVQVPPTLADTEDNRKDTAHLYQTIENFDDNFGKIIRALKESNIYEESLIIVTTDHGLANPFAKCNLTKEGTHIQLIMRHPNFFPSGVLADKLVSQLDIFPTICDVTGIEKPDYLCGTSILEDENDKDKETYHQINYHTSFEPQRAIRTERYLYVQYLDKEWDKYNLSNCDNSAQKTVMVEAGWPDQKRPPELFYDLYFDPQEKNNQIDNPEYTHIIDKMRKKLQLWREEMGDSLETIESYAIDCKINEKDSIVPSSRKES